MAEPTNWTIEQIIDLPKGTTPWYLQNQDAYRHIKNTMDTIADISGGGEPGFGSAIDVRHYVADTSGSSIAYSGVTRPAANGAALVIGISIIFDATMANQGACTLDLGTSEGPVDIKQYGDNNVKRNPSPANIVGPTLLAYDGQHWVLDKSAARGEQGEPGPIGIGLHMKGEVDSSTDLPGWQNSYDGQEGDTYLTKDTGHLWAWTSESGWIDLGAVEAAEPPFDLTQNSIHDLEDVSITAVDEFDVLNYNGANWVGSKVTKNMLDPDIDFGSLTGGGTDKVFLTADNTINYPYTIPVGRNAMSIGPLTQLAEVTIPDGSAWAII
jgi:hypothetical protein